MMSLRLLFLENLNIDRPLENLIGSLVVEILWNYFQRILEVTMGSITNAKSTPQYGVIEANIASTDISMLTTVVSMNNALAVKQNLSDFNTALATKAPLHHTHLKVDITDLASIIGTTYQPIVIPNGQSSTMNIPSDVTKLTITADRQTGYYTSYSDSDSSTSTKHLGHSYASQPSLGAWSGSNISRMPSNNILTQRDQYYCDSTLVALPYIAPTLESDPFTPGVYTLTSGHPLISDPVYATISVTVGANNSISNITVLNPGVSYNTGTFLFYLVDVPGRHITFTLNSLVHPTLKAYEITYNSGLGQQNAVATLPISGGSVSSISATMNNLVAVPDGTPYSNYVAGPTQNFTLRDTNDNSTIVTSFATNETKIVNIPATGHSYTLQYNNQSGSNATVQFN